MIVVTIWASGNSLIPSHYYLLNTLMKRCSIAFLFLSFAVTNLFGQVQGDSLAAALSKDRVLTFYEKAMEGTHHLYNGSEYFGYESLNDEHPYFITSERILAQEW